MKQRKHPFDASVVISNHNGRELLDKCLASLHRQKNSKPEIIVVDCGSNDGAPEMVAQKYKDVILIRQPRIGIGQALNIGLEKSRADVVVFDLNNDDQVANDWLSNILLALENNPEIGIVSGKRFQGLPGSKIIDTIGGKINLLTGSSIRIGMNKLDSEEFDIPREIDYTGVVATRRNILTEVGLLDPTYFFFYEDTDFCYRAKLLGYKIIFIPKVRHWHLGSSTIGRASQQYVYYLRRGRIRFILKLIPAPWFLVPFLWTLVFRTCIDAIACFPVFSWFFKHSRLAFLVNQSGKKNFRAILSAIAWNIRHLQETFRMRARTQRC